MQPIRIAVTFIEDCGAAPSGDEVVRKLVRYGREFGLDRCIFTGPPLPNRPICQPVTSEGWPLEWYQRYRIRNYITVDGMAQWAIRTNQPFTYREVPDAFRLPDKARRVRAEAAAYGLVDGFVVPIGPAGSCNSAVILNSSSGCDLGPQDKTALQLMAIYALGFVRADCNNAIMPGRLSAREREVLTWTAEGKSAWETSVILSVAERTVAKHLEHVRIKLNAATTTQAVAEAFRLHEIVL